MVNARIIEKRRDWLNRLGVLALCVTAAVGIAWVVTQGGRLLGRVLFSENVRFIVQNIAISSDGRRIPPQFIRDNFRLAEGMNLFAINIRKLRESIESVPRVRRAEIRRVLPDTLKIQVVERVAIARLGDAGSRIHFEMDGEGCILGPSTHPRGLPLISGVDHRGLRRGELRENEGIGLAIKVLDLCNTNKRLSRILRIERIDVSHPDRLVITMDKERVAYLAREDVEDRLKDLAVEVQHAEASGRPWKTFNNTVKNNPAVQ